MKNILAHSFSLIALAALSATTAHAKSPHSITLEPLGSVAAGSFLTSAAEIPAHDPATQRVFVVNAQAAHIDVVDISNPSAPAIVSTIDVTPYGAVANSVAVRNGVIAVAVEATVKTDAGHVVFFQSDAAGTFPFLSSVEVGALPDMLTFSPDGRFVLTANEGEPNLDYSVDPEGSVSIIDVSGGAVNLTQDSVRTAGFGSFTRASLPTGVRIFGPDASVAQDLEPEYIAISQDSKTAWVTLQENNGLAIVDLTTASVTGIAALGTKDHSLANNGFGSSNALDASDRDGVPVANDGRINIQNWPVKGLYMPDGIASFQVAGQTYLALANEGDAREYDGFVEEARIGAATYPLDAVVFPNAATLKNNARLGRLKTSTVSGDLDGDGDYDEIHTFGTRSFSIRSVTGALLWDSGDQFEKIIAARNPAFFNSNHEVNKFDDRSDDKGPEPEGVVIGKAYGRNYAFVALERVSGIMIYDLTSPTSPVFVDYINHRDFTQAPNTAAAGDLGPEGLAFISDENSPNGKPLLVIANEVSGTTTIYQVNKVK